MAYGINGYSALQRGDSAGQSETVDTPTPSENYLKKIAERLAPPVRFDSVVLNMIPGDASSGIVYRTIVNAPLNGFCASLTSGEVEVYISNAVIDTAIPDFLFTAGKNSVYIPTPPLEEITLTLVAVGPDPVKGKLHLYCY